VVVHREPSGSGFGSIKDFSGREPLSPLSRPEVTLLPEMLVKPPNE
jgi:hypothetical protein